MCSEGVYQRSVNVKWKRIKGSLESSHGRERGNVKECEELGT